MRAIIILLCIILLIAIISVFYEREIKEEFCSGFFKKETFILYEGDELIKKTIDGIQYDLYIMVNPMDTLTELTVRSKNPPKTDNFFNTYMYNVLVGADNDKYYLANTNNLDAFYEIGFTPEGIRLDMVVGENGELLYNFVKKDMDENSITRQQDTKIKPVELPTNQVYNNSCRKLNKMRKVIKEPLKLKEEVVGEPEKTSLPILNEITEKPLPKNYSDPLPLDISDMTNKEISKKSEPTPVNLKEHMSQKVCSQ